MVVAAVDQDDLGISVPQRVHRRDPGKTAADDHDALALSAGRLDNRGCLVRPGLPKCWRSRCVHSLPQRLHPAKRSTIQ